MVHPSDKPPELLKTGDILNGRYRIERTLGRGGMGTVVAAQHLQLNEYVAIKVLNPAAAADETANARFLREARACAKLKNEHVIRVLDFGIFENGAPVLVMEYLAGQDLAQILAEKGKLSVGRSAEYLIQACEALAEAHSRRIVHRDLKPSNLFVTTRPDGTPLVKVLDFGVSKMLRSSADEAPAEKDITAENGFLGSPAYVSPEVLSGARTIDHRADVWALGVILFESLTGKQPFGDGGVFGVLAAVLKSEPASLSDLLPDVPPALTALVTSCLTKAVEQRCPDVLQFVDQLVAVAPSRERLVARDHIARLLRTAVLDESSDGRSPSLPEMAATSVTAWRRTRLATPWYHRAAPLAIVALIAVLVTLAGMTAFRRPASSATPPPQASGTPVVSGAATPTQEPVATSSQSAVGSASASSAPASVSGSGLRPPDTAPKVVAPKPGSRPHRDPLETRE